MVLTALIFGLTNLDLAAHMLMPIAVIALDPRLSEPKAELLALTVQWRVEAARLVVQRHRVKDLVLIHPGHRRAELHLQLRRLKLKKFDDDHGVGCGRRSGSLAVRHGGDPVAAMLMAFMCRSRMTSDQQRRRQYSKPDPVPFHIVLVSSDIRLRSRLSVMVYGRDLENGFGGRRFLRKETFLAELNPKGRHPS